MAKGQRGISLIELIMFMVIVGIAMAGIISSINYNVRHSADALVKKQALAIAESMMEEIMQQNYSNPSGGFVPSASPPPITERDKFDDVSDYNGYTSSGIYSLDNLTTPLAGLSHYTVTVNVAAATLGPVAASVAALHITVTVTGPFSTQVLLESYRTNYGS